MKKSGNGDSQEDSPIRENFIGVGDNGYLTVGQTYKKSPYY